MRYLTILFLFSSLFAEFKVIGYGISYHPDKYYILETKYVNPYTGRVSRIEKEKMEHNSDHKLIGLEYEFGGYSITGVSYKNSFYNITNAVYVSKLWKISGLEYKLSVGLATGYGTAYETRDSIKLMGMPSIQKKIGNFEVEVGILGTALFTMLKYNFGE